MTKRPRPPDKPTNALVKKEPRRSPPLTPELVGEIQRLHRLGFGSRRIAKTLGVGRKQVRGVLPKGPATTPPPNHLDTPASKLDAFKDMIHKKVQAGLTTTRIPREIKEQGYTGGRTILADYVRRLRGPLAPKKRVKRRFETGPGDEMQVDWSTYQVPTGGKVHCVHAFASILKYSRKTFVRFSFNQRQSTLLEAHVLAFRAVRGITRRIVYDCMATGVLGTIGKDREPIWCPRLLGFCRHYGCEPFLCRVRDPDRRVGSKTSSAAWRGTWAGGPSSPPFTR